MERVILHSDLNSFYASVECLYRPEIREKPVAVCGSVESRHGIVLAANRHAKKYEVKTGDAVWQAQQKCRELVVVEPHMDRYVEFSKMARDIYSDFSPNVEPFGLDESWIDLTGTEDLFGDGKHTADAIRERIKRETGVTVSIGVSFTKVFAKLGSDMKKPDATTVITRENYKDTVWPLPASDLLYVGPATTRKLYSVGIDTIGRLAKAEPDFLKRRLGKNGLMLWNFANGKDIDPVSVTGYRPVEKSIGNSTTTPRDLVSETDIRVTTMILAESVAERLRNKHLKCQTVQVYLRYSNLASYERQVRLPFPSCTAQRIGDTAMKLILQNWTCDPLRSIGVRGCSLIYDEYPQYSLDPEVSREQKQEDLEIAMQGLRNRFGHFSIQRGIMVADRHLSDLDPQAEASPHTVAFFKG